MGVGSPGLEQSGEGPAEASRGSIQVDGGGGGEKPKSGHSPFVREEYREWWEARFCCKNWNRSGPKAIDDPSLYLPPMGLYFVKKAFGGSEQVSTI